MSLLADLILSLGALTAKILSPLVFIVTLGTQRRSLPEDHRLRAGS